MNYSEYSITLEDLTKYKSKSKSSKIEEIWQDLTDRIKKPELKKEAIEKGYEVIDNPDIEEDVIAFYLMFRIPKASKELQDYLFEELYPYVVCLKEEE